MVCRAVRIHVAREIDQIKAKCVLLSIEEVVHNNENRLRYMYHQTIYYENIVNIFIVFRHLYLKVV